MPAILYPLTTEKAVAAIERENSIVLIIDKKATKGLVKQEAEKRFGTKIKGVNVVNCHDGRKKAIIKFTKPGEAADIASKLKII